MAAPSNEQPAQPRPLLRNHDYLLLWSGQTVSAIGASASQIAFPLLVLALTGSAAQAGIVGGLQALPYLFLSLPAGVLVDRWDRKLVMIGADSLRAINMASVPLAYAIGHLSVPQLWGVALIEGSFFVFFNIAEVACLPRVVAKSQLPDATAQNQMMYMFASMAGPPLGGFLFQSVGRVVPFLADAVSYVGSVVSLLFIRTSFQEERAPAQADMRTEIKAGISWLWHHRLLRQTAVITGASTLLTSGGFLLLIVLAKQMGVSPAGIGAIVSIASIGGLGGALLGPRLQRRFSFGQVFIGSLCAQALLIPPFVFAPNPLVLTVVTTALFVSLPISGIVLMSYRLALIPDELQGRVNAVYRLVLFAPAPAGMALTGLEIQALGVKAALWIMFCGLAGVAGTAVLSRRIRQAPPVDSAAAEREANRAGEAHRDSITAAG